MHTLVDVQGRVTGAMGLPVPEQRPGDCYVWGSSDASIGAVCDRQQSALPAIVDDSTHLDVCQVCRCFTSKPSFMIPGRM